MVEQEPSPLKKLRLNKLFKKLRTRRDLFYKKEQNTQSLPGQEDIVEDKEALRETIRKQTEEFLAKGGKIKKYGDVKTFKRRRFNTNSIFD